MQHVMQQATHFLLSPPKVSVQIFNPDNVSVNVSFIPVFKNLILHIFQVPYQPNPEFVYFDMDDMRKQHYSIPEKTLVFVGEGFESQRVVLCNSLTWRRAELVTIRVSTRNVKVSLC
jgi:hypothetical protein